jgi:hypothetical protein
MSEQMLGGSWNNLLTYNLASLSGPNYRKHNFQLPIGHIRLKCKRLLKDLTATLSTPPVINHVYLQTRDTLP